MSGFDSMPVTAPASSSGPVPPNVKPAVERVPLANNKTLVMQRRPGKPASLAIENHKGRTEAVAVVEDPGPVITALRRLMP